MRRENDGSRRFVYCVYAHMCSGRGVVRPKIREILDDCIAQGIDTGYHRAHKYNDFPSHAEMIGSIEDEIWLEIDRHFDFERNVCDEVVEGFDHLEKEREWVGLTKDEIADICESHYKYSKKVDLMVLNVFAHSREIEAKLKEKNT